MELPDYRYYKHIFSGHSFPLAFVDLDLFDENIRQIKSRAGEKKIRIASKSIRCTALMERIFKADAQFQGIMAYHPSEAIFLVQKGFQNILLGYPCVNSEQVNEVLNEQKYRKEIIFMIDSEEQANIIHQIATQKETKAKVCIDIDMSVDFPGLHFGVYRSGINRSEKAKKLIESLAKMPYLELVGIMGYEAQVAGLGNRIPGNLILNQIINFLQKRSIPIIARRRKEVVELLPKGKEYIINAGGTGSLESSSSEPWVTEVTAGSGFYSPGLFDYYKHFQHFPAMGFGLEITRIPQPGIFTCAGGGYIASGTTENIKAPKPYLPEGIKLLPNEGAGEVQTPVKYKGKEKLKIGDPIFFRHSKAGELCERFQTLYLVSKGKIVDQVETYRGAGQCFL
ncbi:MAG: amino acid deaminase/aldolase [Bacteroidia bacterium]